MGARARVTCRPVRGTCGRIDVTMPQRARRDPIFRSNAFFFSFFCLLSGEGVALGDCFIMANDRVCFSSELVFSLIE